ncbi:hypothetical protein FB451DRAFT_1454392 [Mycena latifolia]|nr:hypothetical protein FB451DRAFT_1454392 [Mycena latifolia]
MVTENCTSLIQSTLEVWMGYQSWATAISPTSVSPKRFENFNIPSLSMSFHTSILHQQIARFWVLLRNQLPVEAHISPPFVRKQWDSQSDIPAPSWAHIDTDSRAWKVLLLWARGKPIMSQATDLESWAYGMTDSEIYVPGEVDEAPSRTLPLRCGVLNTGFEISFDLIFRLCLTVDQFKCLVCPPSDVFTLGTLDLDYFNGPAKAQARLAVQSAPDARAAYHQRQLAKRQRLNPPEQPQAGPLNSEPVPGSSNPEPMSDDVIKLPAPEPTDFRIPSPEPLPNPPQEFTAAGRPVRAKRKTWKLLQQLPEPPVILPEPAAEPTVAANPAPVSISTWVWQGLRTSVNSFGLFRDYPLVPTYNSDEAISIDDLSDTPAASRSNTATLPSVVTPFIPTEAPPEAAAAPNEPSRPETGPFRNFSVLGLMDWMWTGSATKSMDQMVGLVDFLQSDQFKKEDIMDFNVKKETAAFDKHLANPLAVRDGWKEVSVNISVPDGKRHDSESDAPIFPVRGPHVTCAGAPLGAYVSSVAATR